MNRHAQRGFTLAEVMITVIISGAIAGTIGASIHRNHQDQQTTSAYSSTLQQLRSTTQLLAEDVRAGRSLHSWRLENGMLYRESKIVARHIARFEVEANGTTKHIAIQPMSPADGSVNPSRLLTLRFGARGRRSR